MLKQIISKPDFKIKEKILKATGNKGKENKSED